MPVPGVNQHYVADEWLEGAAHPHSQL